MNELLLGIILDSKLFFEDHIQNLCKKARQILNALARKKDKSVLKVENRYESIYNISIWVLSLSLDVS